MYDNYGAPRWSGEILDCGMPMTFDTYSKCSFRCLYCFGLYQKSTKHNKKGVSIQDQETRCVSVKRVKRLFNGEDKTLSGRQFKQYIDEKITMQWGGLTDPFDANERSEGQTLRLMQFFKEINYPLRFSTKATWWLEDKRYVDIIRGQKNWVFMLSIINKDEALARKIECGVPSPAERIEALGKITDLDCGGAILRLRPFIIGMSNKNNEHIKLIKEASVAGAEAMSTEFFCLERRGGDEIKERYRDISDALGFDIVEMYRRLSKGAGYLRLNKNVKKRFIQEMKDTCDEVGMRFHVSDAHLKEEGCSGVCCGLPPHMKYSKGQFTEALMIAKENGVVFWSDISEHMENYKTFPWRTAAGFNTGTQLKRVQRYDQTMYDYIRSKWNEPNSVHSPYMYFSGAVYPSGIDDNGDIIYKYSIKRT